MSKEKTTPDSGKRKQERGSALNGVSQTAAGELHQIAGGEHSALSGNRNSLRANPRGPTLLEDFHLRETIKHLDHERIPERMVHARVLPKPNCE